MNILDFTKRYYLHDSLIEEINYNKSKQQLCLKIDFCYWMQENYREKDPETGIINLIFNRVPTYDGICGVIDSFSILDCEFKSGRVAISILDDFNDDYYELSFKAESVEIIS